ncbi:GreA/GreB family elongation factor [Pseudomonas sp. 10B1]|nr:MULTISPECIES: GreA/GreB family elongation factor [unclassified Pseudomonas]MDY7560556.1 GreA/GreB family elongation factor [Pseudomonas sp. AB6]MEA9975850.1 GreA/GreB family elongation factor [Pseudomonas sp. RTS4]MEA9993312.1 GreA/GreB family elongation factor [Pseudomonas sp. AA4]MEB0088498.1 GreA/GreB family elongation factor [Pseudomonas sp. RTI1]MEB0124201.1 GreA/GreB family elongation factor [Pseudomonas sp. CCC1.2]
MGEIYGRMDYISIDSPTARALLKKVGDDVIVPTPGGPMSWWINVIEYLK